MQKLKSKKNIIIAVACVLLIAIAIGITLSYFTDEKDAENIFTVGDVRLNIVEPNYPQKASDRVMYSESVIAKDPTIINIGSNSEYVYMLVSLPKENVTLLDENGQKINDVPQKTEIFKLMSNSENQFTESNISYDSNWIFLGKNDSEDECTYIFAYKDILEKSGKTSTLFDKVQLKSFIEGELSENAVENIGIKAYGIQSDNLIGVDLPSIKDTRDELKTKLTNIYNIYARQNEAGVIQ